MEVEETWSSNLTITNVTMDDEGTYTCMARNGAGSGKPAEYSGILTVKGINNSIIKIMYRFVMIEVCCLAIDPVYLPIILIPNPSTHQNNK